MEFKTLCDLFDLIKKTPGHYEKAKVLRDYFTKCRENQSKEDTFALMRLILPKLDRERGSYNMKESKIARVLIKMLALPAGNDREVLSKSYLMSGQASDFGDVVYSVIRKYLSKSKTVLKIHELNSSLDDLSKRSNEGEAADILMELLFKKCSAEDSRWIIRIILKDLKLGIDGNRILNCYHRDGANYFASNNSLKKVCEILYDQNINLHELDIEIFEAFRPMLSKRVDAAIFKKHFIENKLFYIENKFDGERFQLHMQNGTFKYFSRRGFDFTETFGSTVNAGIFTPKLTNTFQPFVQKIILDGEMMLWNKQTQKYGSKGMELDVKKLKESGRYQPCFCIYDIILLNDNILTNRPLRDRYNILRRVLKDTIPGTIALSEVKETHTQQEIVNELNWAVDHEEEGIIVKDPDSIYKYSDRNSGWYKMKLEYFQDTMNDLDLILMGGQFASSTSDQLNSFVVGVRSGQTEDGKPIYLSFGKVSSGLNDDELDMLNKKIKSEGRIFDNNQSASLVFGKEVPNYFIEPDNSVIFVVRASELTRTTDYYKTSYTLRFPRVLNIRTDKPVEDCLDMNELLELTNKNKAVIKLNKKNIELEEILQTKVKKMKKKVIEVVKFEDTRKVTDLLEGYLFHVLNGTNERSKDEIEALVKKAGGNIFYKVDNTVDIVLVGVYNAKAKELSSQRRHYDVIDLAWLYRTIQDGTLLAYETKEIYCTGTNIKNCLSEEVDRYGDSYTKDGTIDSIKHSFQILENLKEQPCFRPMIEIPRKRNFEKYVAYFDKYGTISDSDSNVIYNSLVDELEFRYYYGTVCQQICDKTNLVIIENNNRKRHIEQYLDSINRSNIVIKTKLFIYK
ncbi:unnamed protein product [Ceutorhynchus assimilis]|uniref:DNA ligase 4 n=1 Tax=Ceutorhynchus assimilis TaxID=467358 RepID=A0A9N9MAK7_9CUCU|nr:unnamed protein product [Ceutorhynchus assimilis]